MEQGKKEKTASRSRFRAGVIVFLAGFFSPVLIPLVALTHLPTTWKVTISGLLVVGIPEVAPLVAVAIMGKSGFAYLKERVFSLLKKYGPPERVSHIRYRIGLAMFLLPILFGWLAPYVSHVIPEYEAHRLLYGLGGDVLLVASLFVLGGEFWDKVRSLFIHDAQVKIPLPQNAELNPLRAFSPDPKS